MDPGTEPEKTISVNPNAGGMVTEHEGLEKTLQHLYTWVIFVMARLPTDSQERRSQLQ